MNRRGVDLGPWSERRVRGAQLEMAGAGYVYPGGVRALKDVTVTVEGGTFLAVMGANGSGKSTLLKHLVGLLEAQEGSVRIDGIPVTAERFAAVAGLVGYLFQDPNDQLFCPTVGADIAYGPENLGLPAEEVDRRVSWAGETCGVSELLERPIHALSYGQKKRVALAGVLAMGPRILVLDEPTGSLDPLAEGRLMRLLEKLNRRGLTVVMATHDVDLVPLCAQKVLLLQGGAVAAEGNLHQVFHRGNRLDACGLRLPRISYLFEVFADRGEYPLTVGEARRRLVEMIEAGRTDLIPLFAESIGRGRAG